MIVDGVLERIVCNESAYIEFGKYIKAREQRNQNNRNPCSAVPPSAKEHWQHDTGRTPQYGKPITDLLKQDYSTIEARIMSTFTAAQLEEKINPTPAPLKVQPPYLTVKDLEKVNEDAACQVVQIANVATLTEFRINTGQAPLVITDKYTKRMQGILRDMRKDQEAILNETAAKLAKVQKALG